MCARREGGNRRSCVHEEQSSIRWDILLYGGFQDVTTSVQEFRVCDWWYNVKCENSAEYFDRNLDLMIQVGWRRSNLNSLTFLDSGPKKKFAQLFIFVFTWPWPFQLSWRRPKPGAILLQGWLLSFVQTLLKFLSFRLTLACSLQN